MRDEDVKKFYDFLNHKEESELRLIKPRWESGDKTPVAIFVKSKEEFVNAIKQYDGKLNIYVGINERKVGGNKDEDIEYITCIGHDIDAHDGGKVDVAKEIANQIKNDLISTGYKEPLVLCSGRGYWVLHKIEGIRNTKENVKRIKKFGKQLKEKYERDGIELDSTVYNPSRIARVPGTINVSDKDNPVNAFIENNPILIDDKQLQEEILRLDVDYYPKEIKTNKNSKEDDCPFLNYCLTHEVPSGERHKVISRNMSLYLKDHPNRDELKRQYGMVQNGSEKELDTWLASIEKNSEENYPFSCGEMINFQKKYKIPMKCRGCPKFKEYVRDKKSEDLTKEVNKIEGNADYSKLQKDVLQSLLLKNRDRATELIVKYIKENNFIYSTRDDIKSEMWIYKEGVYIPQGKTFVREFSREILGESYTTNIINVILSKIEADTFIEHDEFFNTNHVYEVPLINGVLDIRSRKLIPHNPEKIFFNKLPIKYDETADCPNIIKHFETTLKDKESVDVMLELFGYLLLKEYKIEKAIMFLGSGRNGKSKTIELMKRFIGVENTSCVPLRSLNEESFSLSELFGKMANLAADLSKTDLKETGVIKNLIGRDTIDAKRKYLNNIRFQNYAKIIFGANDLPKIYDTTDGFWTKWVLLEFPYKFVSENVYNEADENSKKMLKIMDTDIIEHICKEEEMSGLLNYALDGLDRLLEKRDFSYSKSTAEVKDMWIRKSDSFTAFCWDHIEEGDGEEEVTKNYLRKLYSKYTRKYKVSGTSDKSIHITLEQMYGVGEGQNRSGDRVWKGIKLRDTDKLIH